MGKMREMNRGGESGERTAEQDKDGGFKISEEMKDLKRKGVGRRKAVRNGYGRRK